MNCEQVRELFADYLAGSMPQGVCAELDSHVKECAACREEQKSLAGVWNRLALLPEIELSPAADRRFRTMLEGYRAGLEETREKRVGAARWADWIGQWWPREPAWQVAVVLLLLGGGVLGGWLLRPGGGNKDAEDGTQLAELRQEVLTLKEQMALALLEQKSASERLRGVEWTSGLDRPDEQILGALLRALDSDPNVNVRLAVVDALQPFAQQELVRKGLFEALPRQESPLVQVELIHLLVELGDKGSVPILRSLVENREIDESVRARARWGVAQLG